VWPTRWRGTEEGQGVHSPTSFRLCWKRAAKRAHFYPSSLLCVWQSETEGQEGPAGNVLNATVGGQPRCTGGPEGEGGVPTASVFATCPVNGHVAMN
jgi:hypothetical protein